MVLRARRAALLASATMMVLTAPAGAADTTIPNGTTTTTQLSMSGTDTLTVAAGGKLSVLSTDPAVNINNTSTNVVITNSGTIEDTKSGASRAIRLANGGAATRTVTLTNNVGGIIQTNGDVFQSQLNVTVGNITVNNYGTMQNFGNATANTNGQVVDLDNITSGTAVIVINNFAGGTMTAADSDAIRPGNAGTVNNYGAINGNYIVSVSEPTGNASGNDGIDFQHQTLGGAVNNFSGGTITGARHGITGDFPVTVINAGTITGSDGSGINLDTGSATTTIITNSGTISGTAIGGDGDGIDVDGLITLNNSGSIRAFGSFGGEVQEAVTVGGGTINNNGAGSLIRSSQRAITVDDSALGNAFGAVTIYNEGTIQGDNGQAISITSTFANTLTNKGTISGSTVLGAGNDTVNLYVGSSTGTIDGGLGNDMLNLLGNGSASFTGISNFEVLSVQSGTWTLTGNQTYTTGTVASGATISVDGNLTAALTVAAGGRVNGTGTISNLTVNGTVAPGHSIGTMNVGSITFGATSTYEAETNATLSDKIIDSGAATITAGAKVSALPGIDAYANVTNYTILTATGTITGTFTGGVTSSLPYLIPSLSYPDTHNVVLTLTRDTAFVTNKGSTPNQIAVGKALDVSPTNSALFLALVPLTGASGQAALDALSGEIHPSVSSALLDNGRFMADAIGTHLNTDNAGDGIALWAHGTDNWGHMNSDGNAASAHNTFDGVAAGIDMSLNGMARLGVAAGYSEANVKVPLRLSAGKVLSTHIAGYGEADFGDWGVSATASYAWHNVETNRSIVFTSFSQTAFADYDADATSLTGEVHYRFAAGASWVEPRAEIAWTQLRTDSFAEAGGTSALNGASVTEQQTSYGLGARAGTTIDFGGSVMTPHAMLGWRHASGDQTPATAMTFQSTGASFVTAGAPLNDDALVTEAGVSVAVGTMASFNLSYAGQYGSNAVDHAVHGDLSVHF